MADISEGGPNSVVDHVVELVTDFVFLGVAQAGMNPLISENFLQVVPRDGYCKVCILVEEDGPGDAEHPKNTLQQ